MDMNEPVGLSRESYVAIGVAAFVVLLIVVLSSIIYCAYRRGKSNVEKKLRIYEQRNSVVHSRTSSQAETDEKIEQKRASVTSNNSRAEEKRVVKQHNRTSIRLDEFTGMSKIAEAETSKPQNGDYYIQNTESVNRLSTDEKVIGMGLTDENLNGFIEESAYFREAEFVNPRQYILEELFNSLTSLEEQNLQSNTEKDVREQDEKLSQVYQSKSTKL